MNPSSHRARLLVVDEDQAFRAPLVRILSGASYECVEAQDVAEARRLVEDLDFDAALVDIGLPGESGIDLLRQLAADHPDVAVVMVTGVEDPGVAALAFEIGAYGYVVKPFQASEILISVAGALRRRELEFSQQLYVAGLESTIRGLRAVGPLLVRVDSGRDREPDDDPPGDDAATRLSRAIAARNDETAGHLERVGRYAEALGREVSLAPARLEALRKAAPLHDVGKIGVPDAVLLKAGPLTDDERAIMQRHARLGHQLLSSGGADVLRMAAEIALGHHEWWDGGGYPRGRQGDEIPEEARIVAVVEVFDALTSDRVYRPAHSTKDALRMMAELRGRQFEPRLFNAFVGAFDHIAAIRREHPDVVDARIRVLIVDDEELFVESLARLLAAQPDMTVVGRARSVAEARQAVGAYEPDVVLMDMQLPDGDGAEATELIRAERPEMKIVMLTGRTDSQALVRAISAGCCGFVTKVETVDKLGQAIRDAHDGEIPFELRDVPRLLAQLPTTQRGLARSLTTREVQVLGLVAGGAPNKAIARELNVSLNTLRNHVQSVLRKLDAHSKLEAIAIASREGIIPATRVHPTGGA